jgi:hypothetical protein
MQQARVCGRAGRRTHLRPAWRLQGGMFVFDGHNCMFSHYDPSTAAHADLGEVVTLVSGLARQAADLGKRVDDCPAPGSSSS